VHPFFLELLSANLCNVKREQLLKLKPKIKAEFADEITAVVRFR
jgi:hypothetical protein